MGTHLRLARARPDQGSPARAGIDPLGWQSGADHRGLAKSGLDCRRIGQAGQLPARHGSLDRLPDPLRSGFHVPVADMGVAQRRFRVGVPEHPCDRRQRDAPGHRLTCDRVSQVVQADVLDPGFLPRPVPEPQSVATRLRRVFGRREKT